MKELQDGLKAEIWFWHELIQENRTKTASPEYQRMEHALALARKRLAEYEQCFTSVVYRSREH